MSSTRIGIYVKYKGKILRMSHISDILEEIPIDYYLYVNDDEDIDNKCIKWGQSIVRPVKAYEIEWMYEIKHFLIFQGKKYNGYWFFPDEGIVELSIYEKDRNSYDSKYDVIMVARGEWILKVPIDEVTLYETKTYLDKDKYMNEGIEEVLSEETYLIDEPYWLEELNNN